MSTTTVAITAGGTLIVELYLILTVLAPCRMLKLAEIIKIMPFAKESWLIIAVALAIWVSSQNSANLLKAVNKTKPLVVPKWLETVLNIIELWKAFTATKGTVFRYTAAVSSFSLLQPAFCFQVQGNNLALQTIVPGRELLVQSPGWNFCGLFSC